MRQRILLVLLLVILIAVPILEVWLLIQVGRTIGIGWTLLILIAEAVIGAWLVRREGSRTWRAFVESVRTGQQPDRRLADAALVLVGGCLLVFPGFFTDVIGLVFLLPFTRPLARFLLGLVMAPQFKDMINVDVVRARWDRARNIRGEAVIDSPSSSDPSNSTSANNDGSPIVIKGEVER